jgi:hypothetical protein
VGKGKIDGYLIVVDVPNPWGESQPVTVAEVSQYLN